jgi:hypothetical protein
MTGWFLVGLVLRIVDVSGGDSDSNSGSDSTPRGKDSTTGRTNNKVQISRVRSGSERPAEKVASPPNVAIKMEIYLVLRVLHKIQIFRIHRRSTIRKRKLSVTELNCLVQFALLYTTMNVSCGKG